MNGSLCYLCYLELSRGTFFLDYTAQILRGDILKYYWTIKSHRSWQVRLVSDTWTGLRRCLLFVKPYLFISALFHDPRFGPLEVASSNRQSVGSGVHLMNSPTSVEAIG
ncbi:hypothetical protein PoB_004053600 [Plakobranchus ocellatus]|uniref:Uncharacterized protein n=1 Tax=Plakobranchus ocellatus TaxID=259542 RepID=A0AAV4B0K2_9GAST|nr:hypothetical protein PoB_004053600 [Plakobranchus ocellatus]